MADNTDTVLQQLEAAEAELKEVARLQAEAMAKKEAALKRREEERLQKLVDLIAEAVSEAETFAFTCSVVKGEVSITPIAARQARPARDARSTSGGGNVQFASAQERALTYARLKAEGFTSQQIAEMHQTSSGAVYASLKRLG